MPIDVEITSTPGLIDAETGQPTTGEPYSGALADFLASNGVANTAVALAAKEAMIRAGQGTAEEYGWWDAIRHFFAPEVHQVVGDEEHAVELVGYWLTLPNAPDAKVTLAVSVTDKTQKAASLKIAGVGGGPSFDLAVKSGLEHEATSQQRAVLTTMGTFQRIEVTKDGEVLGHYARLVALDRQNVDWSYPEAALPSSAQLGDMGDSVGYDARSNTSADKVTLTITKGTTWDFSIGIKLDRLGGIEAGVSAQVSYECEAAYTYLLPQGHRYRATRYATFPAFVWTLD